MKDQSSIKEKLEYVDNHSDDYEYLLIRLKAIKETIILLERNYLP
tara:strand:- start:1956 stop:2090 length:135 start_codon:yes stop_codon:yes gene_type:complete